MVYGKAHSPKKSDTIKNFDEVAEPFSLISEFTAEVQKQPFKDVLRNRYSENLLQIY